MAKINIGAGGMRYYARKTLWGYTGYIASYDMEFGKMVRVWTKKAGPERCEKEAALDDARREATYHQSINIF